MDEIYKYVLYLENYIQKLKEEIKKQNYLEVPGLLKRVNQISLEAYAKAESYINKNGN